MILLKYQFFFFSKRRLTLLTPHHLTYKIRRRDLYKLPQLWQLTPGVVHLFIMRITRPCSLWNWRNNTPSCQTNNVSQALKQKGLKKKYWIWKAVRLTSYQKGNLGHTNKRRLKKLNWVKIRKIRLRLDGLT